MRDYLEMLNRNATIDELIHALREDGFSKVQSMKALVDLRQADLKKAKQLVHLSETWADRREQDDEFHHALFDELSNAGDARTLDE